MARTALTEIVELPVSQLLEAALTPGDLALAWEACDVTPDFNEVDCTGQEILLFRNDDVGAQTVRVYTKDDNYGRTGDTGLYSIPAGEYAVFAGFPTSVWRQADEKLYIDASDAGIFVTVLKFAVAVT